MSNLTMQPLRQQAAMVRARRDGGPVAAVRAAEPDAAFVPATLAYQPTRELARGTVDGFVSRLSRFDTLAARAVAETFARNDCDVVFGEIVAPFGLRGDKAADTLTA